MSARSHSVKDALLTALLDNTATLGTILGYVFYWLLAMVSLLFMKWREGRMPYFPRKKGDALGDRASSEPVSQPETPYDENEKDVKGPTTGPQVMSKTE